MLFTQVLGFDRLDDGVPLLAFVFLVALGVDYNIFLVTRAAEEARGHGAREGMLRALSATGGVITSAGILLAAVFAVLGVLPLVVLAQLGVVICIGVLLDTLVVRTVLVPAIALVLGDRFWWPRRVGGADRSETALPRRGRLRAGAGRGREVRSASQPMDTRPRVGRMSDAPDIKPRSRDVTDGLEKTAARGMLRAVGMGDDDWVKPQIGVASSWNEITPCNLSLDRLAKAVKDGVHAGGGYPLEFGTISVSDGISMGHEGMHFSLVSREIIADSVETVMNAERLDGSVLLAGCDKSPAGHAHGRRAPRPRRRSSCMPARSFPGSRSSRTAPSGP